MGPGVVSSGTGASHRRFLMFLSSMRPSLRSFLATCFDLRNCRQKVRRRCQKFHDFRTWKENKYIASPKPWVYNALILDLVVFSEISILIGDHFASLSVQFPPVPHRPTGTQRFAQAQWLAGCCKVATSGSNPVPETAKKRWTGSKTVVIPSGYVKIAIENGHL